MRKNDNTHILFHELLYNIVQDFGEEILLDSRLKGIINDLSSGSEIIKYQSVISRSISCRVGERVLQYRGLDDADFCLRISTLKQKFQEDNFFQHGISDYIIDSYLYALGCIEQLEKYDLTQDNSNGNAKAGELSFVECCGEEYCGNISKDNQRSGFGISKRDDGGYFAGEWKLNMKTGVGMEVTESRTKYAGEWRMNRKNGIGIALFDDGTRYSGEWKNGKMHGTGILYFPNGEQICANFSNGEIRRETGMFILKDGSSIVGIMTLHGPHGVCTHFLKDGTCVEEEWINGNKK